MKRKLTTPQQLEAHDQLIAQLLSKFHNKDKETTQEITLIANGYHALFLDLTSLKSRFKFRDEQQEKRIRGWKITTLLHSLSLLAILYLLWLKL